MCLCARSLSHTHTHELPCSGVRCVGNLTVPGVQMEGKRILGFRILEQEWIPYLLVYWVACVRGKTLASELLGRKSDLISIFSS